MTATFNGNGVDGVPFSLLPPGFRESPYPFGLWQRSTTVNRRALALTADEEKKKTAEREARYNT